MMIRLFYYFIMPQWCVWTGVNTKPSVSPNARRRTTYNRAGVPVRNAHHAPVFPPHTSHRRTTLHRTVYCAVAVAAGLCHRV